MVTAESDVVVDVVGGGIALLVVNASDVWLAIITNRRNPNNKFVEVVDDIETEELEQCIIVVK